MIFFYSRRMTFGCTGQSSVNAPNPNVQPSIAIAFIYCLYLFWNHLERIKLFELEVINFFIFVGGNLSALISLLPKRNEIFTALSLRRL